MCQIKVHSGAAKHFLYLGQVLQSSPQGGVSRGSEGRCSLSCFGYWIFSIKVTYTLSNPRILLGSVSSVAG